MNKIAIFGTSADPPTIAHKSILEWLADHFDLVAVYASNNPFKDHSTNLSERSEMLKLLIKDLNISKNNVIFCQEISDRYSLNTIKKAREKWGNSAKFYLVIGSDLIDQIHKWYRIEELLKKVTIMVMPRPNFSITPETLAMLKNLGGKYEIAEVNLPAVSSTKYRHENDTDLISQSVKSYIEQKKFYLN